jgi:hypothetical protein
MFKTGVTEEGVKEKLAGFKAFAVAWFGADEIRHSNLYNPSCW